jgi:hypothetical protein
VSMIALVGPGERDLAVFQTDEPTITDRDPMRVTAEIFQHVSRSAERSFGIDDPFAGSERLQKVLVALRIA